jgi:hypothetical protein
VEDVCARVEKMSRLGSEAAIHSYAVVVDILRRCPEKISQLRITIPQKLGAEYIYSSGDYILGTSALSSYIKLST